MLSFYVWVSLDVWMSYFIVPCLPQKFGLLEVVLLHNVHVFYGLTCNLHVRTYSYVLTTIFIMSYKATWLVHTHTVSSILTSNSNKAFKLCPSANCIICSCILVITIFIMSYKATMQWCTHTVSSFSPQLTLVLKLRSNPHWSTRYLITGRLPPTTA